jgi:hypothetical protein
VPGSPSDDRLFGNFSANVLIGNGALDALVGRGGDDLLASFSTSYGFTHINGGRL